MTRSLCSGLVHIAALLHILCAAWAQELFPLRIAYSSSNRNLQYDCLGTNQFVKLGNPAQGSNPLVLCDSQDIRLSFSPLSEKTDCWHRCTIYDVVSSDTERWARDVANDVRQEIEDRVGLRWPARPVFIADDGQNDVLEVKSEAGRAPICPAIQTQFLNALPEHSLTDEDVRVYITLRPNPAAARGITTICRRDRFGRPAIAHINIHAPFAKAQYTQSQAEGASTSLRMRATILHETMHALALTSESLQQFRAPSRRLWGSVVEDADVRGIEAKLLVTPNVAFEVRKQYRIEPPLDTADSAQRTGGLEILGYRDSTTGPQQEAPISDEVHVSPQVARNEISCPSYDEHSALTNVSLAILDDSGWYVTNRSVAERLTWGLGQGGSFLRNVPSQTGAANATISPYNCKSATSTPKRVACSYEPEFKGFCISPESVDGLAASAFSSYVNPVRQLGSCKTGMVNPLFNGSGIIPEQTGDTSMCFELNAGGRTQAAVCLSYECVPGGVNISVASQEVFCRFGNTSTVNVELRSKTQVYTVACPSMQAACPQQLPELQCPGDCNYPFGGICQGEEGRFQCSCSDGWSGDDCSVYSCTGDSCPPATAISAVPDSAGTDFMGTCSDGDCECAQGFTGVDCRLPEPSCLRDCALLGQGYHCVGDVCERQCSTDGRSCMLVEDLQNEVQRCEGAFEFAKTTHVCVPPVNTGAQITALRAKLDRERDRWRPIDPSNPAADSQECKLALEILACFSVFRECRYGSDVELPLCLESCKSYGRNCGVELSDGMCAEPTFRNTRDSSLCSGSANPKDYLSRAQKFGIIFGAIIAFLLIVLLLLLWLYRCGPCCRQEVPPIPPRMRELTDDGDAEEEVEVSIGGSSMGLQMGAVDVQQPPPFCGLSRRRWHGNGRFAQPGAADAAYAHDVSSTPGRSNGGHVPVPTPPLSHLDSTASAPDTGDVASSLPSQYHSGGHETPPVNTMAHSATETVAAAHSASLGANGALQPVSYGAHTTMQPQLLASAFSAADDPPLLQQSWQQDALWKGGQLARPAAPPRDGVQSGSSSDTPTPQRSRSPLSRHATNHASSPFASRPLSIENNSQQTNSFEGPHGTLGDGPSGRFHVNGTSSLSSRQLAALSGSVMLHTKPKSRAPGSRVIRKRRGTATASSGAHQSSGTAPSAQNDTDLERIANMLSGGSSRPRSPERMSEFAQEGTGRRSPLANVSTNLDWEPTAQPPAIVHPQATSASAPGAQSHSSTHEASPNESRMSSCRRSGDASPRRTSTRGSAGMPVWSPSPPEIATSRYPGSWPRSREALSGVPGAAVGPAAVGAAAQPSHVATHFGPEADLQLSPALQPYREAAVTSQRGDTGAACSAVEARVMDHNAALGFFPPAADTQDPFLDETVEERAPEELRPVGMAYGQGVHLVHSQLNSATRDVTASITLQLPSLQSRALQPGQPGASSFRRGFASVGSLSLTGRHRNESVQTVHLERHASDPFLTDTVNLDEDFRDPAGPSDRFKDAESLALSHGAHHSYSGMPTSLHQVSEMSEPGQSGSLSVGGTGTIPVAARQMSQCSSEVSGASDPFLSDSQV